MCSIYACGDLVSFRILTYTYTYTTCKEMKVCSIVSKDWCVPVVHVSLMYRNVFSYYSLDTPFNYSCGCNARARSFPTCETVRIYKLADGSNT